VTWWRNRIAWCRVTQLGRVRAGTNVVPRWAADGNCMAVTGDTRVLPQSLEDTYATLRPRLP